MAYGKIKMGKGPKKPDKSDAFVLREKRKKMPGNKPKPGFGINPPKPRPGYGIMPVPAPGSKTPMTLDMINRRKRLTPPGQKPGLRTIQPVKPKRGL